MVANSFVRVIFCFLKGGIKSCNDVKGFFAPFGIEKEKPINIKSPTYNIKVKDNKSNTNSNNSGNHNTGGSSSGYNNGGGYIAPPINVQQSRQEWHNCSYCNGIGKHSLCNGRGQSMCKTCNGTGQHYNTYTGFYERCVNSYCIGGYTNCSCSGGLCPSCNGTRGSYY
jgi:hypothetical protein